MTRLSSSVSLKSMSMHDPNGGRSICCFPASVQDRREKMTAALPQPLSLWAEYIKLDSSKSKLVTHLNCSLEETDGLSRHPASH